MKWRVVWVPRAESELAAFWLDADIRNAVSHAANRIDEALLQNPEAVGESREFGLRVTFESPIGVTFRVVPPDRLVQVLDVWLTIPRG